MDSTTQLITTVIILIAFVVSVTATQVIRRRRDAFPFRAIPAYEALPLFVGGAIEAGRAVHVSLGDAGIGGRDTALALAGAELFFQAAQRATAGAAAPILTVGDTTAIPLGYGMLRRAYASRDRLERFDATGVRWFPGDGRSLAFVAALTATIGIEKPGANIIIGGFGAEMALALDAAQRRNQTVIAASVDLEGQAVAYALSDRPLIGEEIFAAGAYFGEGKAAQRGALVALDTGRWLLIAAIIVATYFAIRDEIGAALATLGGG